MIRGGHLVNVAQLVSMKGEEGEMDVPLQYLSVVQSSISLNPIKLLMEVKILEKCPSYVQSEAGCVTQK